MNDIVITVEFTHPVLACGVGPDGESDRFQRDGAGKIIFQQNWFHAALTKGISLARLDHIKAVDIQFELLFTAPTEDYNRRYGGDNYRLHESIPAGTKVEFNAIVADHINLHELRTILDKVGKFVGISPYGHNLGYGKFNVISVENINE